MITQELLQHLFDYDPEGFLIWKNHPSNYKRNGLRAGSINGKGYYVMNLFGKSYRIHRLIWLYHKGYLPDYDKKSTSNILIDHKDRNKINNCIENLREVTISQNNLNRSTNKTGKIPNSGTKGIHYSVSRKKYKVQFYYQKQYYYFGMYKTLEEAEKVYNEKRKEIYGDFHINDWNPPEKISRIENTGNSKSSGGPRK